MSDIKHGTYSLYGDKDGYIKDDSSLYSFCKSLWDTAKDLVNVYEEEYSKEAVLEECREILRDDLPRTDINYEDLLEAYVPEIGNVLYVMDNNGYDMSCVEVHFFGDKAHEFFDQLVDVYLTHITSEQAS